MPLDLLRADADRPRRRGCRAASRARRPRRARTQSTTRPRGGEPRGATAAGRDRARPTPARGAVRRGGRPSGPAPRSADVRRRRRSTARPARHRRSHHHRAHHVSRSCSARAPGVPLMRRTPVRRTSVRCLPASADTVETRSNRCLIFGPDFPRLAMQAQAHHEPLTRPSARPSRTSGAASAQVRGTRGAGGAGGTGRAAAARRRRSAVTDSRDTSQPDAGPGDDPRAAGRRARTRRPHGAPAARARHHPVVGRVPRLPAEHARDRRGRRPDQPVERQAPAHGARAQGLPAPGPQPPARHRGRARGRLARRRHLDGARRQPSSVPRPGRRASACPHRPTSRSSAGSPPAGRSSPTRWSRTCSRSPASSSATATCSCSRSAATR